MAGMNHQRFPVETISRDRQLLTGSFQCNGTSNPTGLEGDLKKVGTVARTGAGVLVFTFTNRPGKILDAGAQLRGTLTGLGDFAMVAAFSAAAGTITVHTRDAAGLTDIPLAETIRVSLWVWCSHMSSPTND